MAEIAAGDPAAAGDGARRLLEAASSGDVDPALANPTRAGFLAGLNVVLTLGALLAFAGGPLAVWLVREQEIEREPVEPATEAAL